jgi:hypothetical protein
MKPNPAGSKLGNSPLGRRPPMRVCLTAVALVLALATLAAPAAWADDQVSPDATTSAEPTPEPTSSEPAVGSSDADESATDDPSSEASEPVATQDPPSEEPTAGSEVPTSEEPDGDVSGSIETGAGGEGGGAAQAPVEEGPLAAAAEQVRDPRASIGDVDCTNLTVPVTLDNSRSTEPVVYEILAGRALGDPTFEETIRGATGAIRIMNVPVSEDTRVSVLVYEQPGVAILEDHVLAFATLTVDCNDDDDAHDPQASIGGVDCASLTAEVTLDNSRSEDETIYIVTASEGLDEETTYEEAFSMPAREVQTVRVPIIENLEAFVAVETGDRTLAWELFQVDCTPGDEPRASIGAVNCTNLTVPVTLDNTSSAIRTTFLILTSEPGGWPFGDPGYFPLASGAERAVAVPVLDGSEIAIVVADETFFGLRDFFAYEDLDVDCVRVLAGRAAPQLAATGANGLTLPMAGLTLLAGGGVLTMLGRRHG